MEQHTMVEKGSLWVKLMPLATGLSAEIQRWDSLFPNVSHVVISKIPWENKRCLTYQITAVLIKLADLLKTNSVIQALRWFIGQGGPVREIQSNRGTNFIRAKTKLNDQKLMIRRSRQTFLKPRCGQGEANQVNKKHHEQSYERTCKSSRQSIAEDVPVWSRVRNQQQTFEHGNNKWPSFKPPLSPSILLTGKTRLTLPPPGEIKREDLYCSKKGRCTHHLAQEFWLRWSKEYLQQLQAKTKWAR